MNDMRTVLLLACAAGLGWGQEFEVVSIKPNNAGPIGSDTRTDGGWFRMENVNLFTLLAYAHGMKGYQVEAPGWTRDARFDIQAKYPEAIGKGDEADRKIQAMLQNMLKERFKLAAHRDTRQLSVNALMIGKSGIKFKEVAFTDANGSRAHNTHYVGTSVSMDEFSHFLSSRMDQPVLDMTGLKGYYDLKLDWEPLPKAGAADLGSGVSLPMALQDQLGLKLEARKAPVEILIVDHVEKVPTEN